MFASRIDPADEIFFEDIDCNAFIELKMVVPMIAIGMNRYFMAFLPCGWINFQQVSGTFSGMPGLRIVRTRLARFVHCDLR